jgi:hypothetical protein
MNDPPMNENAHEIIAAPRPGAQPVRDAVGACVQFRVVNSRSGLHGGNPFGIAAASVSTIENRIYDVIFDSALAPIPTQLLFLPFVSNGNPTTGIGKTLTMSRKNTSKWFCHTAEGGLIERS